MPEPVCDTCAPRVGNRVHVVSTTSDVEGKRALHRCVGGKVVTSRVVSWHLSKPAAQRAARVYHRKYGARAYHMTIRHPERWIPQAASND